MDERSMANSIEKGSMPKESCLSLTKAVKLKTFPAWSDSMQTLQLLANSYKHGPLGTPSTRLRGLLKLKLIPRVRPVVVTYASLPESRLFRKGLARSLE